MSGWKTWAGCAGLVVGAILNAFGQDDAAKIVYGFAVPMVIVGVGHKLDKVVRMAATGLTSVADQLEKLPAAESSTPKV